jgi:hypothetical protein
MCTDDLTNKPATRMQEGVMVYKVNRTSLKSIITDKKIQFLKKVSKMHTDMQKI